jgi:preprotein translocase subunit SecA
VLEADWQLTVPLKDLLRDAKSISEEDILEQVLQAAQAAYQQKVEAVGAESWSGFERSIMLQVIDTQWREHLSALDHLRQGIHLRGYAQKNPKQEYKREAFELFSGMLDRVRDDVVRVLMTVRIQTQEEIEQAEAEAARAVQMQNVQYQHTNYEEAKSEATQSQRQAVAQEHPGTLRNAAPKVGRNDPCPCGSGKKYKHCHGQLT